ncbi:HTH-type transcriptional regulator CdhR [Geobacter sp. OR-1]|uniref:DJ-1/PfpI family protein n=1 Tax=Geobacter sp. OR-1 TaxID=1266765 RepID=UPI000542D3E9|nr:helix-turn-helix domain-containing protein [Geobacter sp. OR-1]GAM08257.1 HTH-type transcriptional regulator CdhR [Geobacter sp. OR-1]
MPTVKIAIVAFNYISPFQLSVPCLVFGENRLDIDRPHFAVKVCAAEEGELQTNAGFSIQTHCTLKELADADIVIVPSWRDANEIPAEELLSAIRDAFSSGAIIVGLCLGAFVLAAAGLLSGRPATTHWLLTDELAKRYPDIDVRPDVLYVDDGQIITSAGVAAGIDCCLHLLRRLHGAEAASRVARRMVVPPHRQGGQAQYIETPVGKSAGEDSFSRNLEWVRRHLELPHTIDTLAARFFMSRRTFTRRFREATGTTVGAWLLGQRLAMAQRLLETSAKPIGLVAQEAGFGSEVSLRLHFSKELQTSPARYRREFRGNNA